MSHLTQKHVVVDRSQITDQPIHYAERQFGQRPTLRAIAQRLIDMRALDRRNGNGATKKSARTARHSAGTSSDDPPWAAFQPARRARQALRARYTTTMARPGILALDAIGIYRSKVWGRIIPVFLPNTNKCGPRAQVKNMRPMTNNRRTAGSRHWCRTA